MSDRIQLLDELGAELARVAAEAEAGRASRRRFAPARRLFRSGSRARTLAIAVGITAALGTSAYATRTAFTGVAGTFSSWVTGASDDAPGRALHRGEMPSWFPDGGETRVIAETAGIPLMVRRSESDHGPMLDFWLGPGMGMGGTLENWRERLDRQTVVVLGNSIFGGPRDVLDDEGRVPFFGVTARGVARIELRYADDGPPLRARNGDGGFVVLVHAWRRMRELVVYDRAGEELARVDLRRRDLTYLCEKEPGCPPPYDARPRRRR